MFRETTIGDRNGIEELVRAGDDCPGVAQGLRERIIAEAVSARALSARQSQRGRVRVVLGLSLALALFVGLQPSLCTVRPEAIVFSLVLKKVENSLNRDSAAAVSTLTNGPDRLDWNQVESMTRLRRWQARVLRSAFSS